ncbi:hypothetical protein [Angustibacter luteus]|uniref:Tox-GHH domain-containing protein n=1 Tax=Angustibacter luteus TaxID=658456 RepID=A0ABW1JCM0_9ACTN
MSSRTAGASRAIKEAWENERRLVLEGKGTRDWSEEHQRQIKDKGKAYDDQGRAFEGQHMKSVSSHPEYQDDPRNIQFLSREEHLAAHGGNWKNLTNGYYDPASRRTLSFGNSPPQPCVEMTLTNPLYVDLLGAASTQTSGSASKNADSLTDATAASTGRWRQGARSLQRVAQQASKDPRVRAAVVSVIATVATEALNRARSAGTHRTNGRSTHPSMRAAPGPDTDSPFVGRQSPEAHSVSGYTKRNGTNVRPYRRGGK